MLGYNSLDIVFVSDPYKRFSRRMFSYVLVLSYRIAAGFDAYFRIYLSVCPCPLVVPIRKRGEAVLGARSRPFISSR